MLGNVPEFAWTFSDPNSDAYRYCEMDRKISHRDWMGATLVADGRAGPVGVIGPF